uniref:Sulfotransferase n=1 Tax=Geotrypetes seraphini TaxID=260995 RepID=A0A6P8QCZ4_GEOSA|nr:carbohydrate sulfotransferase 1 [Geotrypetes seraphini]
MGLPAMKCFWKAIFLLALASIAIHYTAIQSFTAKSSLLCTIPNPLTERVLDTPLAERACDEIPVVSNVSRKTHILILATTRSGSSFVGQIFNQHFDIFYLFEPLYHVQNALIYRETQAKGSIDHQNKRMVLSNHERHMMLGAGRDLLRSLYECDLHFLENYIKPKPMNHTTNRLFRRGASKALCSPSVCESLEPDDTPPEEVDCIKKCGTLNLTLAVESCKDHEHVAIKTVRVPEVSDLRPLVEDPRLNLKIIQLVRDPRGILASRSETFQDTYKLWRIWRATGRKPYNLDTNQLLTICKDYLNSVSTGLNRPSWLKGKYLLLRYEDMARNPIKKTEEIYNFLGISMDSSIVRWIENNTRADTTFDKHKYGTIRNSEATAKNWRQKLSFDIVEFIQNTCQEVLVQLGYKLVNSDQDLRNLSFSLVEEKTFSPFF